MPVESPPSLHPFLRRNAAGELVVHWWRLAIVTVAAGVPLLIAELVAAHFTGRPPRPARILVPYSIALVPQFVILHFAKRRLEGRRLWHFSLSALFIGMTAACVVFALVGMDRRADLERVARRDAFVASINEIIGAGKAHVERETLIQVKRPSFNDDDLRRLLALREQLEDHDFQIYFIDLTGTSVTDAGVADLKQLPSLKYCFLDNTTVTDTAVDALGELPLLHVFSLNGTQVTPERLSKLHAARPALRIEPQTYLKLK